MRVDVELLPEVWLWTWVIRAKDSGRTVEHGWTAHWEAFATSDDALSAGEDRLVELRAGTSPRRPLAPSPRASSMVSRLTTGDHCPACHSTAIEPSGPAAAGGRTQTWRCRVCASAFVRVVSEGAQRQG